MLCLFVQEFLPWGVGRQAKALALSFCEDEDLISSGIETIFVLCRNAKEVLFSRRVAKMIVLRLGVPEDLFEDTLATAFAQHLQAMSVSKKGSDFE